MDESQITQITLHYNDGWMIDIKFEEKEHGLWQWSALQYHPEKSELPEIDHGTHLTYFHALTDAIEESLNFFRLDIVIGDEPYNG